MKSFRGRRIKMHGRYPAVTWPDHPCATKNGLVRIHRVIAYEKYGDKVLDSHTHHKNGNVFDWGTENIELVTPAEHVYKHKGRAPLQICRMCEKSFRRSKKKGRKNQYCSMECAQSAKEKIDWPSVDRLLYEVEATSYCALARRLGVSDNAIRKRIINHMPD